MVTTGDGSAVEIALKKYAHGTHRVCSPAETLARVSPLLPAMGITRVANVTGLDTVGMPVVMVSRPNSRSLAVAQGKGATLLEAKASGVMEAIESYHGEHIIEPIKIASYEELRYTHNVIDPTVLPRLSTNFYHRHLQLAWIAGREISQETEMWVPYEIVHTNFVIPMPAGSGCFVMSSNGAAAGNHPLEAISHGICEVIERDATALWHARGRASQAATRMDLGTVDDPACAEALQRFEASRLSVAVWDTTTDIGIPAFLCSIVDRATSALRRLYASSGSGCH